MYEPNYTITDNILNNIVKLEIDKQAVENTVFSTRTRNRLSQRAKTLDLFHFAHILNVNLTLRDAEKVSEGKRVVTEDIRGTVLNNYRNVLEFTRSNISDTYVDIDLNIILHLNKILLTDWRESWEAKFRTGGEGVDLTLENWATLRDESIEPMKVQQQIALLIDWYKNSMSKVHDLLRVGVFIEKFIEICPLLFANKLTAIAIADYLLYKNGYVAKSYLPTSRNFDVYEDEYLDAWNQIKNNTGKTEGKNITIWLERLTKNLASDMRETKEEMRKSVRDEEKGSKQPFLDLNKRQLKILRYLQTIPTVKREDYVHMMDVSTMTAYRDLTELVEKKLLKIEGQGRGTKYMLYHR